MPLFPELPAPLSDGVVELRLAKEWDIPDILIAHQDDRELYRRLGLERPPSAAELGRHTEHQPEERAAGAGVRLTLLEPGDDTCRGQLDVHQVDWTERSAELGIWVAAPLRGRGLGSRALRLGAGWLLDSCGLERLTLITEPDNLPMIHAARTAGFLPEQATPEVVSLALERRPLGSPTA